MTAEESKFLKAAIRTGLKIQHRFVPEPVLAKTGKGYMKSEGVETLQRIKASKKGGSRSSRTGEKPGQALAQVSPVGFRRCHQCQSL
jgi:hypothetical protein